MEEITQPRGAVGAATIAEAFRITAANRADDVAIRTKGDEVAWTWGELRERVDALAAGLAGLGLKRGDTVALLFGNRPEFHLSDLAVVTAGGTPFSIYVQYGPEQIRYVVGDAGARMIITEQQYLDNVIAARKELPDLEHVIVVDAGERRAPEGVLTLEEVVAAPDPDFDADASVAQIGAQDVLTIIYTSGTTGPPKGVQLSHRNLLAAVAGRGAHRPAAGRARDLVAAQRARRRAQRASLHPDRLRAADHLLPQPARGPRLPARGPPVVVLRRAAHLGEAQVRPGGDGRRPTRRPARDGAGRRARRDREGAPRAARGGGPRRPRRARPAGRPRDLRRPARDARPRPGQGHPRRRGTHAGRGARVLPRHRPAAGGAVGDERDVRRGRGQPAREDQDRHRRAAGARRRDRSSTTTASCWSAATS